MGPGRVKRVTGLSRRFELGDEIRKTSVVKMSDLANERHPGHLHGGGTREQVARLVLEEGPITAAAIAKRLGLSPAAVRRHLDALLADGEATTRSAPRHWRRAI